MVADTERVFSAVPQVLCPAASSFCCCGGIGFETRRILALPFNSKTSQQDDDTSIMCAHYSAQDVAYAQLSIL